MLDIFALPLVQTIDGTESEALEEHSVPALEGDFLQDLGRRAARIKLAGMLTGADAGSNLKTLRDKYRAAAPVSFVADIATATKVDKVLIEALGIREIAGRPERFELSMDLVEYIPAPPPQHEQPPPPPPPVPPPPPPDTKTGVLKVTVIVDGDPAFDFSKVTVTAAGQQDDGTPLTTTLTNRTGNVWTVDPMPPGSYTAAAAVDDPPLSGSTAAKVVAGQRTSVEIHLQPGPAVAHGFIVHYWFDRAFIEPCLRRVLRDVAARAQAHPDEKILIVGNTDLTGGIDYNQALSERRARGAFAYLTAGRAHDASVAEWDALRHGGSAITRLEDNWSVREYQHMLAGLNFYSGPIDEVHGALTDAAVRNFQSDHGLPVDGIVGDATWHALIDAYLSGDALAILESQFLPNCPSEVVKWLGSGLQDPVRNTEDAWRPNRRSEIVFVKANALPGKVAPPATFNLPVPGAVNAGWCVGAAGDPVVILSRNVPRPNTFFVQPAEPGSFIVKLTMQFEDGSPAAGVHYVLTAPDGEYMDGERPSGPSHGRPIPGTTGADGSFTYPTKPKGPGVFILSINGAFTVRLKDDAPNSGTSPIICAKLDGSKDLDVVLAPADGTDPRRKLQARIFDRSFAPLAGAAVTIAFPDGSTANATTDTNGRFSVIMGDAFPTANLRYVASADPNDLVQLDYFVDVGDIATDQGVSRRLHNLGFKPEPSLPDAIAQFQGTQGLDPSGTVDDPTRAQLNRVYLGDAPLFPAFDDTPVITPPDPLSTDP
ncbi:DNA circularisation protein N-terminus [Rhizobiales bacterium GAS191]|nr:DNA circularisation protein N-terminus [Rhizobiales bacterium GAS191]